MKHPVLCSDGNFREVDAVAEGYGIFAYMEANSYVIVHGPSGVPLTKVQYLNEVAPWIKWAEGNGLGEKSLKQLLKEYRSLTEKVYPEKGEQEIAEMCRQIRGHKFPERTTV